VDLPLWAAAGDPPGVCTFEAVLWRDGNIDFQYLDMRGTAAKPEPRDRRDAERDQGRGPAGEPERLLRRNALRVHISRTLGWLSRSPAAV